MKKFLSLVFAICMALTCAFTLSACDKSKDPTSPPVTPPSPPSHSHNYFLSTYAIEQSKAYKVKKCSCGDYEKEQEIVGAIIVNSEQDLSVAIKDASQNSTIVLQSGTYPTLTLVGKNSFPQNLTIIGTDNAVINGLSITSGVKYETILTTQDQTQVDQEMVSQATLNGNLTFKNLSFGKTVAIRNASIDGFNLYDCEFIAGAGLVINSNVFYNYYGCDAIGTQNTNMKRKSWCVVYTKNLVVENCSFNDVSYTGNGQDSALLIHSVDNATIKNCVIDGAEYNAIQINGVEICPSKGTILIESNILKNTEDRLMRFNCIEEGSIITLKNNALENSDTSGRSNGEIIKASVSGVEFVFIGNSYCGQEIDELSEGVIGIP